MEFWDQENDLAPILIEVQATTVLHHTFPDLDGPLARNIVGDDQLLQL